MNALPSTATQKRFLAFSDTSSAVVDTKPTDLKFRYTIPKTAQSDILDDRVRYEIPDPRKLNIPQIKVQSGSLINISRLQNNDGKTCILHNIDPFEVLKNCRVGRDLPGLELLIVSNLLTILTGIEYPISEHAVIYSKKIFIFKDDSFEYMQRPFSSDIVSIDTPILEKKRVLTKKELNTITYKMRTAFIQMYLNGVEYPILCALGLGGYNLDQGQIREVYHRLLILERMAALFKKVTFVINDSLARELYSDVFEPKFVSV